MEVGTDLSWSAPVPMLMKRSSVLKDLAAAPNDLTLRLSRLINSKSTNLVLKVLLSFLSASRPGAGCKPGPNPGLFIPARI